MTVISNCFTCKYYLTGQSCLAFPEKIPDNIFQNEKGHKKPIKGQKGDYVYTSYKSKSD